MEQLTKEEIIDLSRTCYQSTEKAAKIFFPERFSRPFDDPHLKLFDLIDKEIPPIEFDNL